MRVKGQLPERDETPDFPSEVRSKAMNMGRHGTRFHADFLAERGAQHP